MLRGLKELEGYAAIATDGDLGKVANFLLDDQRWVVRYLVVEAGGFLTGRRVLISPISLRQVEWSARRFHLALTKIKVKNSPGIDADKPVSRQHEFDYHRYYGYPYYWGYSGLWGMGAYPGLLGAGTSDQPPADPSDEASGDIHLRSAAEVRGYNIEGGDEAIGHVADFLIDDETWVVHYLVVDIGHWWPGRKVLVAPWWASRIRWEERTVPLDMSRQQIKNSPEWNATAPIHREYEARLYDHYGRPGYWADSARPEEPQRTARSPHG